MPEPFVPDDPVPPGGTLLETIEVLGMTQAELAARTGRPLKTINEIIKGKAAITPETALQLQHVLGIEATFWNKLERNYREALAHDNEQERLNDAAGWLKQIPVNDLIKRKLIKRSGSDASLVAEVLRFFGVSSPKAWKQVWDGVAFRRSPAFTASPGAMAAWLRIGEVEAQKIACRPFDSGAFKCGLTELRQLTVWEPEAIKTELVKRCKIWGIAVVFTAELPKTHVSGATQWLTPEKALMQLSCRFKADDHFWFTFFHEAGHILLHGKKGAFIDTPKTQIAGLEEEANTFAANLLIPSTRLRAFLKTWNGTEQALRSFASEIGIAPGIVVGQLQHHHMIKYYQFNHLKRRFDLTQ
jgi:HTH-type transcriptional regulator/antitoxin HigA